MKDIPPVQQPSCIFRTNYACSKWTYFHRAYLLTVPKRMSIAVYLLVKWMKNDFLDMKKFCTWLKIHFPSILQANMYFFSIGEKFLSKIPYCFDKTRFLGNPWPRDIIRFLKLLESFRFLEWFKYCRIWISVWMFKNFKNA